MNNENTTDFVRIINDQLKFLESQAELAQLELKQYKEHNCDAYSTAKLLDERLYAIKQQYDNVIRPYKEFCDSIGFSTDIQ